MNKNRVLSLLWKGALFGIANIIPGVSGGTMAVVTGVYDEFMEALGRIFKHWRFLVLYAAGALIGIAGGAFTIDKLFELWPAPTLSCFMGFILGGIPFLIKTGGFEKRIKLSWITGFIAGLSVIIAMGLLFDPSESEPVSVLTVQTGMAVFAAGMAASAAMVIPGISGSFILLLIGMYTTFTGAVTGFNLPIIAVAAAGVAVGIIAVSRVITALLHRYHKITYSVILGLVTASALILWPGFETAEIAFISAITFISGLAGGYFLSGK